MKNSVTQKHDMGCGAACLAFVANKSYLEVTTRLGIEKASTLGFKLKELSLLLEQFEVSTRWKHIKPHTRQLIYEEGTIVFIKRNKLYPYGHYLTRYQQQWMDPWINMREDSNIRNAVSGFRKRLPGKPQYAIQLCSQ